MQHELRFTFDEAFLRLWRGSVSWVAGAILGAGAVALRLLPFRVGRTSARRICDLRSTQSPDRTMVFRFDDEGFDVEVGSASNRYAWKGMRRLWRHPDVWLLEIAKTGEPGLTPSVTWGPTLAAGGCASTTSRAAPARPRPAR